MRSDVQGMMCRVPAMALAGTTGVVVSGCSGIQSSLAPSGDDAERIAALFWWMTGGSFVVWVVVIWLALYYARVSPDRRDVRRDRFLIIGGGTLVTTIVLTVLLVYGLAILPSFVTPAPGAGLRITVSGEQWWWRVRYHRPDGSPIDLANEIRLPVGEPAEFQLASDNVIHSFWIPSLAGKMDMIPGRITRLHVRPTKTGIFRGACAEYCGTSHALMALYVHVMEREDFARWLAHQAAPAQATDALEPGADAAVFLANGCGSCHTIRGTDADGVVGPDLTHVGSRLSLGAGILPNTPAALARWVAYTEDIKPGAHMPSFGMLPAEEIGALARYLDRLQ